MLKVAANIDLFPLYAAITRQTMLWGLSSSPDSIILRGPHHETQKTVNYPAMDMLWQARPHVFGLMSRMEAEELGDVEIRRLDAGGQIKLENERGWQTYFYVLACSGGVMLDQQLMHSGDAWGIETGEMLSNNSAEPAYLMICTMRSSGPCTYMPPMVGEQTS